MTPGYEYVKPPLNVGKGRYTRQIIFYQLRDGDRDLSLRVGYLDARVAEYEEQHEAKGPRVVQRKPTKKIRRSLSLLILNSGKSTGKQSSNLSNKNAATESRKNATGENVNASNVN